MEIAQRESRLAQKSQEKFAGETTKCLQLLASKPNRDFRPVGIPLFSGDKCNDQLSAADRAKIEPNVALFAEKISIALQNPSFREADKCRELLSHVRGSALELLLGYPQTGQPPWGFENLLGVITWKFQPCELPMDLLHNIQKCKQRANESLDAFHIRLVRMGDRLCSVDKSYTSAIDTIIYGTLTRDLPQELKGALELNTDRRDLHSVTNYSKKWMALNVEKMELHKRKISVNALSEGEGMVVAAASTGSKVKCYRCESEHHRLADCPHGALSQTIPRNTPKLSPNNINKSQVSTPQTKCFVCKKLGHTVSKCWCHERSIQVIKKRLTQNKQTIPKEVFSVGIDPEFRAELMADQENGEIFEECEDKFSAMRASIDTFLVEEDLGEGGVEQ